MTLIYMSNFPGHAGGIISLGWPGNASGFPPGRAGGSGWGEGCLGFSAEADSDNQIPTLATTKS